MSNPTSLNPYHTPAAVTERILHVARNRNIEIDIDSASRLGHIVFGKFVPSASAMNAGRAGALILCAVQAFAVGQAR